MKAVLPPGGNGECRIEKRIDWLNTLTEKTTKKYLKNINHNAKGDYIDEYFTIEENQLPMIEEINSIHEEHKRPCKPEPGSIIDIDDCSVMAESTIKVKKPKKPKKTQNEINDWIIIG